LIAAGKEKFARSNVIIIAAEAISPRDCRAFDEMERGRDKRKSGNKEKPKRLQGAGRATCKHNLRSSFPIPTAVLVLLVLHLHTNKTRSEQRFCKFCHGSAWTGLCFSLSEDSSRGGYRLSYRQKEFIKNGLGMRLKNLAFSPVCCHQVKMEWEWGVDWELVVFSVWWHFFGDFCVCVCPLL